ncbi:hypothetical protein E2562_030543 [Oryza meyeriana var. granulata]|uniref:Alpha/beta hydrolase fold-3 domain-containing protein n=1 Tax=Oryza meyeriana var. granulata TaxID=110450 RepID=A0A6G1DB87_9ORYZ|nr:hypothetical protein E2562_030543 [Oryza meyeriana var. granulata]
MSWRRLICAPHFRASVRRENPETKGIVIDDETGVSVFGCSSPAVDATAAAASASRVLLLVVYIHCGAFCTGSASAPLFRRYAASLSARAVVVVVSVGYGIALEHPVPAA